ncbi:tRNA (N(6)-L-threonylcarbamoyladenosine(37)-C(2))-methylthiotransferase MtaB [Acidaminobacter sp. JC074]|uniref:tRNA (N(6)-L-threonylcarbamoyladenosine(37)-C(2))- methylthiotransferase MtaB n=1 Tax=Acidaminobacter sp. JC074 TaxID=2530199 RepID=UPI001F0D3D6B|nr:tRNA (N(6)-L-threonylcarbamoyladenosine(37)-C(2))-methylthiotransferase MtaB [Acidaminobacter sp. JC074]MCH4887721.1 tRNA (N(6)-L-threonylcarbamoyladenosine(37)-C(2))-methylthiotransferase MtaB [Acidaminobacter sp. JC074]
MKKSVAVLTLGCKVNQYESEAMIEQFQSAGYNLVDGDYADYYVINTCTVTSISDRKSRQFMRRARKANPDAVIAVVGCYSQVSPEQVEAISEVNVVLGTNEKKDILKYLESATPTSKIVQVGEIMKTKTYDEMSIEDTVDKTRVFMKIQDGCNQFCSYCIIPYARGPIRSRDPKNVVSEAKILSSKGFKEVVLTGIHLSSYGKDIENTSLIEVIESLNDITGLERIRLGSLEPKIITEDFVKRLSKLDKFCNHFHLSLQSGSDTVLERMNRKYDTNEYYEAVSLINAHLKDASFTTDIIVGFPGESDQEFEETCDFVKKVGFSKVHIFKYSPREGTKAAVMKNQVHGEVKSDRSHKLQDRCKQVEEDYLNQFLKREMKVLFEEVVEGAFEGLTEGYLRVSVRSLDNLVNTIRTVKIKEVIDGKLIGDLLQ